jgi:hypothetical protein
MKAGFELGLAQRYSRADVEWLVAHFNVRMRDVWEGDVVDLAPGPGARCTSKRADDVMRDVVPSAIERGRGAFVIPLHIEMGDIVVAGFDGPARFIAPERVSGSGEPSPFEGKTIASLERVLEDVRSELASSPHDPEGLAALQSTLERAQQLGMAVSVRL